MSLIGVITNFLSPHAESPTLQARLAEVTGRLAEVDLILAGGPSGERAQEIKSERQELLAIRRDTEQALAAPKPPTPAEQARDASNAERRRRVIDAMEREQRATLLRLITKLESEGDHRQAKIQRLHMLGIRERIEQQIR